VKHNLSLALALILDGTNNVISSIASRDDAVFGTRKYEQIKIKINKNIYFLFNITIL